MRVHIEASDTEMIAVLKNDNLKLLSQPVEFILECLWNNTRFWSTLIKLSCRETDEETDTILCPVCMPHTKPQPVCWLVV